MTINAMPLVVGALCVMAIFYRYYHGFIAAKFGVLPGYLWILVGVVLAGAVHDFIIFFASVRHGGKSLAEIARIQISPLSGIVASIAILFILVVALAGLGLVVVNALSESSWGTFTIACTIPIALFMGL